MERDIWVQSFQRLLKVSVNYDLREYDDLSGEDELRSPQLGSLNVTAQALFDAASSQPE